MSARHYTSPAPDRWVRAEELAAITGLSLTTIRKLSMHEDCPVVRSEYVRATLFDPAEFKKWLAKGEKRRSRHVVGVCEGRR